MVPNSIMNSAYANGGNLSPMDGAVREVLSAEILYTAIPALRFEQFAALRTELNTQPGNTITIFTAGNIRRGGQLSEGERIRSTPMSISSKKITVWEKGNAIALTEFLTQTSFLDLYLMASLQLGRDLALTLDSELRDAAFSGTNVVYAGSQTARSSIGANHVLTMKEIRDGMETLSINLAPKRGGDHYLCMLHPHQGRHLREDDDWVRAAHYAHMGAGAQNPVYLGEIGRFEDVRFIESTMCPNGRNSATDSFTQEYTDPGYDPTLDDAGASSTNIYQATMFGENYYALAVGLTPEMRDDGIKDFGREHALAWYAVWGKRVLDNNNGLVIESA